MKKIYWNVKGIEIVFSLNWLEYLILKRIFKQQKYFILNKKQLIGQEFNLVIADEYLN